MDIRVRKYEGRDRQRVREIACQTAFMGEPHDCVVTGAEVVADALSLYYTDHEPQSCFVAEADGVVAGYVIGTTDVRRMRQRQAGINAGIAGKVIGQGLLFDRNNIRFIWSNVVSLIKGEFGKPDYAAEYPAQLHINLAPQYRSRGIGGRLMNAFLDYLRTQRVPGVHVSANSEEGKQFFLKQGFHVLSSRERTQLKYLTKKGNTNFVCGLKL